MKNIYLTGFMGSGKSSTARQVGRRLSRVVIDVDERIRKKFDMDIGQIFDTYGEDVFRKAENEVILDIVNNCSKGHIIALGGGTLFYENNAELIKNNGMVIYLRATPKTIYTRVSRSKVRRPLLEVENLYERIYQLLEERKDKYEKLANIIIDIDGKTSYEVARMVVISVKKRKEA